MGRLAGGHNQSNYHYVIIYKNGGQKFYKTNLDIKADLQCSYKTIQNFLKRGDTFISKNWGDIRNIKKICIPINSVPVV